MTLWRVLTFMVIFSFIGGTYWGYRLYWTEEDAKQKGTSSSLHVLVPDGVFPKEILDDFYLQSNFRIHLHKVSTPYQVYEEIKKNRFPYDLALVFNSHIDSLLNGQWIKLINNNKIKNIDQIPSDFQSAPDPNHIVSLPWIWGINGILYNKKILGVVSSWKDLFKQSAVQKLQTISFLLWPEEIVSFFQKQNITFKTQNNDEEEGQQMAQWLDDFFKRYQWYLLQSDQKKFLTTTKGVLAFIMPHSWAGTLLKLTNDWEFVIPTEKASMWILTWVTPKISENSNIVKAFFNYILNTQNVIQYSAKSDQAFIHRAIETTSINSFLKPSYLRAISFSNLSFYSDLHPVPLMWSERFAQVINSSTQPQINK